MNNNQTSTYNIWYKNIQKVSNPNQVLLNTKRYFFGPSETLYISENPKYKYKIYNPDSKKFVYFGDMRYEDFTKHKDENRRRNYIKRASNIKGNWKDNPYSKNNLAINLLWQ
jgi:hypothetical protein